MIGVLYPMSDIRHLLRLVRALAHVDDAANTVAGVHVVKALVDVFKLLVVRDELVYPEGTVHVVYGISSWFTASAIRPFSIASCSHDCLIDPWLDSL